MKFLNILSDKKYAKYKNRLHYVYAQLYRTQIYKEYIVYKKHKNFQINDGILKINNILKNINKYNKDNLKVMEEISKITNKNQKSFLIYLFLKIFNSWKFLKNNGFILSYLSKYLYNISLTRIWQVKKKIYSNYLKTSFGFRKYTRRYLLSKGFPVETSDDVRCWLFYFKKIGKTNLSLQFNKKEFLYCNSKDKENKNFLKKILTQFNKKSQVFFEKKVVDLKIKYLYSFFFSFSFIFFIRPFCTFFTKKNKNLFFLLISLYYNDILFCKENLLNEKNKDILLVLKQKKYISFELKHQINFIKIYLNNYQNMSLCNFFLEIEKKDSNFFRQNNGL